MKQTHSFIILLLLILFSVGNAFSQHLKSDAKKDSSSIKEDNVTRLQSCDAFNSLEDGQPTPPGHVEFRMLPTYAFSRAENRIIGIEPEMEFTPRSKSKFIENSQVLASFFLEHDGTDNSGQLNLGWNQRWSKDGGKESWKPTIGTLVEANFPLPGLRNTNAFRNGSKAGNFVKITGVYAKFLGPGSLYFNASARKQFGSVTTDSTLNNEGVKVDGDHWTHYLFGFRVGYNWVIKENKLNLIVDYNLETNEFQTQRNAKPDEIHKPYNTIEASIEWVVNKHLTLGPGLLFGIDNRDETPRYGFGCLILVE
jgi:hypothetical protein